MMPRRTNRVISSGTSTPTAAMPMRTTLPPSRTDSNACRTVTGEPSASIATSTPRPFASSRTRAGASSVAPLTAWVAPISMRLLQLVAAYVDRDDLRRAERARHLHHLRAHAADGEDGDALSGADVSLVPHGAVGGEDGAADDGGVRERHALRQREDGRVRRHGVLGEAAHAVHGDGVAVGPVEACRAVVELSLEAVVGEEGLAGVLAPADAVAAVAARHDEGADDAVAHGDVRHAGAYGVRRRRRPRGRAQPGVGKATSPLRTWRSVWQTPHAATLTRTSCSCGSGMTSSSTVMGWLG